MERPHEVELEVRYKGKQSTEPGSRLSAMISGAKCNLRTHLKYNPNTGPCWLDIVWKGNRYVGYTRHRVPGGMTLTIGTILG